jgi:ornithine carbamoyltransferase
MKHFLKLSDFSKEEILEILELAFQIKQETKAWIFKDYMKKKTLGMIFEKSSTRTRVSFETGIYQLGWQWIFLSSNDIQLGRWEPLKDTSRVLSTMVDMVMIRTFGQERLDEFAKYSSIPVINWLSNEFHPVQIMADYMTIIEQNKQDNLVVAYVWDGNNIAHSWLNLASKLWFELKIATPKWYEVNQNILENALKMSKISWAKIIISNDPKEIVKWATVVTTDTWVSMWQEQEKEKRIADFKWFIVDEKLMKLSDKNSIFLHCLPAYRGYEVSENVLEWSQSVVWQEAENRLHVQKWIMVWLQNNKDKI